MRIVWPAQALVAASILVTAGTARAQPARESDVAARIAFIEARLDAAEGWASLWQNGWLTLYSAGVVAQLARAGMADDDAERADLVVSAVQSAVGVTARVVRPLPAARGSSEIARLPESTPAERRAKLRRAEEILRRNAESTEERTSWLSHAAGLALNVAGGLVVWLGYDDLERAAVSTSIGIAIGELSIWSQPWHAADDAAEYEKTFGVRLTPMVGPTTGGAAVIKRF